jgi:hypothetical protein
MEKWRNSFLQKKSYLTVIKKDFKKERAILSRVRKSLQEVAKHSSREISTKVFSMLQKEGLVVAADNLFFHVKGVKFLEYLINVSSVKIFTRKVKVVRSWETPKT